MIARDIRLISEPELLFGHGQTHQYVKDGLLLYGPPGDPYQPSTLRYGVVGTRRGIDIFNSWLGKVNGFVPDPTPDRAHSLYWPGFSAVFGAKWPSTALAEIGLSDTDLTNAIRLADRHHAIYTTASIIEQAVARFLNEEDRQPQVWFVIIPDELYYYGRPKSVVPTAVRGVAKGAMGKKMATRIIQQGSLFEELTEAAKIYQFSIDLHAQLKARLLGKAVLQIVRESTLTGGEYVDHGKVKARQMQDAATTAWNLSTTAFFKAEGMPWRLAHVRDGVCYIGLVFKRDDTRDPSQNVCCGAQMFLDSGDGVVFRGAVGPWEVKGTGEFHLSRDAARDLMALVTEAYSRHHGGTPKEIFLHGRTAISNEEWSGFTDAVDATVSVVSVKIRESGQLKVFRAGKMPLVRGSALVVDERRAWLWTSGYIPRLATYPGWEVPNPLEIVVQRGEGDIQTILEDVMALTKLNYNACIFGDSKPVTLRFADSVGSILTATPDRDQPPLPFRYYI